MDPSWTNPKYVLNEHLTLISSTRWIKRSTLKNRSRSATGGTCHSLHPVSREVVTLYTILFMIFFFYIYRKYRVPAARDLFTNDVT